jgi:hypothetical protein
MTAPGGRHAKFVDKHGRVLESPQLYLIYWGSTWQAAPTPTADQITHAVRTLMASAYLNGLTEYRGSGRGALRGSTVVVSPDPPDGFTDQRVADFVDAQLNAGTIPAPDPDNQTVYGVVMPTGITPGLTGPGVARRAEHFYYPRFGQRIHYAWFTNVGDLDSITALVSHELVESATDPDGSGFLGINGTCHETGWCEIADVCEGTLATVDGIMVQAYWSNQDNECVVPGSVPPKPVEPEPLAQTRAGNVTISPTTGPAQDDLPRSGRFPH